MKFSEYWIAVMEMVEREYDADYFDEKQMQTLKANFKKKWKKGITVEDAYYDLMVWEM